MHKLGGIGLNPCTVAWLKSFLIEPYFHLEIGDAIVEVRPEYGLPQGSRLSFTLFISILMIYCGL